MEAYFLFALWTRPGFLWGCWSSHWSLGGSIWRTLSATLWLSYRPQLIQVSLCCSNGVFKRLNVKVHDSSKPLYNFVGLQISVMSPKDSMDSNYVSIQRASTALYNCSLLHGGYKMSTKWHSGILQSFLIKIWTTGSFWSFRVASNAGQKTLCFS